MAVNKYRTFHMSTVEEMTLWVTMPWRTAAELSSCQINPFEQLVNTSMTA